MTMVNISVVCPTYNSALFIERTLECVVSQHAKPTELIISDDGSSDDTLAVVERFLVERGADIRWAIVCNSHRGPGATRNAGIDKASCVWIAFLDSDDLWMPDKLGKVQDAILENPDANFFCHNEQRIEKNGQISALEYGQRYKPNYPLPPQLYFANMFSTSAITCKRNLLLECGGFNESLMSAQDYELWLRLSPRLKPVFMFEVLGQYVEREGNITSGKLLKRMQNEFRIALMHRHLTTPPWVLMRFFRILLAYGSQYALARIT